MPLSLSALKTIAVLAAPGTRGAQAPALPYPGNPEPRMGYSPHRVQYFPITGKETEATPLGHKKRGGASRPFFTHPYYKWRNVPLTLFVHLGNSHFFAGPSVFPMKLVHGHGHIPRINCCFFDCGITPEFRPPDLEFHHEPTHSLSFCLSNPRAVPPELLPVDTYHSIHGYRIILSPRSTPKKYRHQSSYFQRGCLSAPCPSMHERMAQICQIAT